ncbi:MAG: endopeptidase La [Anaerolineaceae bacterium]|nr:MAG: endopeptidase La [Anaerolineaceae bacterium]
MLSTFDDPLEDLVSHNQIDFNQRSLREEGEESSSIIQVQKETEDIIQASLERETSEIPDELPILPLRGVVVYPLTAVPLTIGQPRSIRLVDDVVAGERLIGLVASRKPELELPQPEDLYRYGTVAAMQRLFRAPDGTIRLIVRGLARFELGEFTDREPYLKAKIQLKPETIEEGVEIEAQVRAARDQFQKITELAPSLQQEILASVLLLDDPLHVAYTIANYQRMELQEAQEILEEDSAIAKLQRLNTILSREVEVLSLGQQIQQEARTEIEKVQREYFLREQLKAIQRELGEEDEQAAEVEEFRKRMEEANMPEEAEKQARRELDRLARLPTAAAEYGVIRTYLDWLVSVPWDKGTQDNLDLANGRAVLDEDHYGLEDVKERILEYLAIRKLKIERKGEMEELPEDEIRREREGVILCFIGPPGVGKTSLGRSIARAMGRKFIRISLGGVHDEAEIRGHRRTYIGAMPGRILQALRRVESKNPVFMLDEVDKLGRDFRGDPASALLEVLDPEQNREFRDHYLEVSYDLSQVMFITTANWAETIPAPLLDRMEVIRLSGYTDREKAAIAQGYLIPRQIRENGLKPEEVEFSEEALQGIIRSYTREAGVRNLEREIGRVCRKVATKIAEGKTDTIVITPDVVREFLGKPRFLGIEEVAERISLPGVATGLAYTQTGGDVLFIEATAMSGSKQFLLTGSLGQVMKESAQAALSHVRAMSDELAIPSEFWDEHDLHLHVPAGSQPKDGPSAGVTMAVALASLATGRYVRSDIGMTGEVTLRGKILPVGGIKEKVLAAHRACLTTVLLPRRNEVDLEDVPEEVRKEINFIFIDTVADAIDEALDGKAVKRRAKRKSPAAAKTDDSKPKRRKAQPVKRGKTSTSRSKKKSN